MGFLESLGRQTLSIFHQLGAVILLLMAAVREISAIRGRETCRQVPFLGGSFFSHCGAYPFIHRHGAFCADCRRTDQVRR